MTYFATRGSVPPKRHTVHRDAAGEFCYEELLGEDGFAANSALLYHRHPPSAIVGARLWAVDGSPGRLNAPLLPRHLRLHELAGDAAAADPVRGRRTVLGNDDVRIGYVAAGAPSPLYRNAVGDECVYVESGRATVQTVFGDLDVATGDYVIVPRGVTHRWVPAAGQLVQAYCIAAAGHIRPPRRYLSAYGQFLEHAPYCERDLRLPGAPTLHDERDVEVYVLHRGADGLAGSVHVADHHPFDVVGWAGALYPYAFNVADFEPITGRIHQPPPAHQVFEGPGFVVCNFVPRKVDYHPLAIPVPYYHSNVDSDEVMFYCGGDYEGRKGSGVGLGSLTLHPGGFPHGPQPAAYQRANGIEFFDELAVMVDTFRPLRLGPAAADCEDERYAYSWAGRSGPADQGGQPSA